MTKLKKKEDNTRTVRIDNELVKIMDRINERVKEFTWGASDNAGYRVASQILAKRIKTSGWYK